MATWKLYYASVKCYRRKDKALLQIRYFIKYYHLTMELILHVLLLYETFTALQL